MPQWLLGRLDLILFTTCENIMMLISWFYQYILLKILFSSDKIVIFHISPFFFHFVSQKATYHDYVFFCLKFFFSRSEDGFSRMIIFHLSNWYYPFSRAEWIKSCCSCEIKIILSSLNGVSHHRSLCGETFCRLFFYRFI